MSNQNKRKRALLIANPGSGKASSRTALIEEITRLLLDEGMKVDVAIAKPKEEAIPIARRAVKAGYGTVIALGGDDTVEAIMRAVSGSKTSRYSSSMSTSFECRSTSTKCASVSSQQKVQSVRT